MHVTIKEVAALAGVSITAVSLVLNNRPLRIAPALAPILLAKEMAVEKCRQNE